MRLPDNPMLPQNAETPYDKALYRYLTGMLRTLFAKINGIGGGRLSATDLTATSIPTTGTFAQGDFVRHSAPVEAGVVGVKYVVTGWICVAGGTPGTFKEHRVLTGN